MPVDQQTFRRATTAALIGLLVQVALSLGLAVTVLWTDSLKLRVETSVLSAALLHVLPGILIWIILWMVYNQHRLEREEALQAGRAQGPESAGAIFEGAADELAAARRRLDQLYRWSLPAVSLAVAAFLGLVGFYITYVNLKAFGAPPDPQAAQSSGAAFGIIAISVIAALSAFIIARYISGMTAVPEWQLLRGGASYLMGNCVVLALTALAAVCAQFFGILFFQVLTVAVPVLMVVVGLEIVLNFVFLAYRPRRPDELPKPAFDSRLLGWFTRPESIARIINETINYQFGIEVSRSWFYRLLGKAITPLIIVGLLALIAVSSLVIVGPHEQAIITTFGRASPHAAGPGLHFKWPWPIGAARKEPVSRIRMLHVGSVDPENIDPDKAILWTNQHAGKETYFLISPTPLRQIGVQPAREGSALKTSGVSLVGLDVVLQYRVRDLGEFVRAAEEPERLLRTLAQRRVNAYLVTTDIDTLMGLSPSTGLDSGGFQPPVALELTRQIQQDSDAAGLGVEVYSVGLSGIHPPSERDVAIAFLQQIAAQQQKLAKAQQAKRKKIEMLTAVVGSTAIADRIEVAFDDLTRLEDQMNRLKSRGAETAVEQAALQKQIQGKLTEIESTVYGSSGEVSRILNEARAERWQTANAELAAAGVFQAQVLAYDNAPTFFPIREYWKMLEQQLPTAGRLIIIGSDAKTAAPVIRLNLQDLPGFAEPPPR